MRLRTQALIIAAVAVVVLAATGVVSYTLGAEHHRPIENVQAASPSAPDYDREACAKLDAAGDLLLAAPDALVMRPIGATAALASDPDIKAAGLAMAPVYAYGDPEPGNDTVEAYRLAAELRLACEAKYS